MAMDPVKTLPTEVFEKILSYLSLDDLMSCCLVSQKWNIAANNESLWKELCLQNNWLVPDTLKEYVNEFGFLMPDEREAFQSMGEWKKYYVLENQLQKNWRKGTVKEFLIRPVEEETSDVTCASLDGQEEETSDVTCASSDGQNIVLFGFDNGIVKIFDLKKHGELLTTKECVLDKPLSSVQINDKYVVIFQLFLFQLYKFDDDGHMDLQCMKVADGLTITNVDIPTLMMLDRNARSITVDYTITQNSNAYFLNENYLVLTLSPLSFNIYNYKLDFSKPSFTLSLGIDTGLKFVLSLHIKNDFLYILLGELIDHHELPENPLEPISLYMYGYSLKHKVFLFNEKISDYLICRFPLHHWTIQSNELYLLVKSELNSPYLLKRDTGKAFMLTGHSIFLNANSNPRLIGISVDDSFQIIDPVTMSELFCVTMDGVPIALHSNVIVTLAMEFNRNGVGSTDIEFWSIHDSVQKVDEMRFAFTPNVRLLHSDQTRMIFYAPHDDYCVVRSFIA